MAHGTQTQTQQHQETHHSMRPYLVVWGGLFVLSALSYIIDVIELQPVGLRWFLFTAFALIKASLIVSYFMHMRLERLSLVYAIVLPPLLLLVLIGILIPEGEYVSTMRRLFLGQP